MEGKRGSSRIGLESIARHTTLASALSNMYYESMYYETEKEWIC